MKKHLLNQAGIGLIVEVIIGAVVLSAIGATGYVAYKAHSNASTHQSSQKTSQSPKKQIAVKAEPTPKPAASGSPSTTSQPAPVATDAGASFLQNFYGSYIAASSQDQRTQLVNDNGTQNSIPTYEEAQGADPIVCAQNIPNSVSVARAGGSNNMPSYKVTESFGGSSQVLSVSLIAVQGSYRLDVVSCPGQ